MARIESVCVYCGSSLGADPLFAEAARRFGGLLAAHGIRLIYGGGGVGLMGELAGEAVRQGGAVTGIIPGFLVSRERALPYDYDLVVVEDMHERKRLMFERADAFVALPGGVGTLEELVEQLTWAQLGQHKKPILIANIAGFWDPLLNLMDHMRASRFLHGHRSLNLVVAESVEEILPKLEAAVAGVADAALHGAGDAEVTERM
jgi:uncharacterized protein (TIGR00730 family)